MNIQKLIVLAALVLALVAAFVSIPSAALILAVVGLVAGFKIPAEEHVRVIISALALKYLADTFNTVPSAGESITAIIGNVGAVAAGAALMIIARNIYARVKP